MNATKEEEPVIYLPQKTPSDNIVEQILFSIKEQRKVDFSQIEKVDFALYNWKISKREWITEVNTS